MLSHKYLTTNCYIIEMGQCWKPHKDNNEFIIKNYYEFAEVYVHAKSRNKQRPDPKSKTSTKSKRNNVFVETKGFGGEYFTEVTKRRTSKVLSNVLNKTSMELLPTLAEKTVNLDSEDDEDKDSSSLSEPVANKKSILKKQMTVEKGENEVAITNEKKEGPNKVVSYQSKNANYLSSPKKAFNKGDAIQNIQKGLKLNKQATFAESELNTENGEQLAPSIMKKLDLKDETSNIEITSILQ